jgi:predicted DNA-binding protein with PD1-like motif
MKKSLLMMFLGFLPLTAAAQENTVQVQVLRLKPGQDLKQELESYVKLNKVQAASVLSAVGSLKLAKIRFANKNEASALTGPLEVVSLSGTLGLAGTHLHMAVSDGTGKTTGGHLVEGNVVFTTMEIVLGIYPGLSFQRTLDPVSTYQELDVQKAKP